MGKPSVKNRPKRPDSKGIATPKVKYVAHGLNSDLLKDPLDGRTRVAKRYKETLAAMHAHLGTDLTLPEQQLVEQVCRLSLLADVSWRDLISRGMLVKGEVSPVLDAWLKVTKEQRAVLQLLGLKRREKPVADLSSYIGDQTK